MRFLILLSVLFACGCTQPTGPHKDKPKPVSHASLEQIAYESFQNRDLVRAKKLRDLKGTRFDGKRIEAISRAGAEASEETWKPVAAELAKRLDAIPQGDQAAFDAVLEEIARGSERAGK